MELDIEFMKFVVDPGTPPTLGLKGQLLRFFQSAACLRDTNGKGVELVNGEARLHLYEFWEARIKTAPRSRLRPNSRLRRRQGNSKPSAGQDCPGGAGSMSVVPLRSNITSEAAAGTASYEQATASRSRRSTTDHGATRHRSHETVADKVDG